MELGIYTFGVNGRDPRTGAETSPERRMKDLVEEIELADQAGLDVFGVGEHHRPDFVVSSPQIVLAAAAARTRDIRLTAGGRWSRKWAGSRSVERLPGADGGGAGERLSARGERREQLVEARVGLVQATLHT